MSDAATTTVDENVAELVADWANNMPGALRCTIARTGSAESQRAELESNTESFSAGYGGRENIDLVLAALVAACQAPRVLPAEITIGTMTYKVETTRHGLTLVGPRGGRLSGVANVNTGDYTVFKGNRTFVRLRLAPTGELRELA